METTKTFYITFENQRKGKGKMSTIGIIHTNKYEALKSFYKRVKHGKILSIEEL